jgi:hypothetical protein
MTFKVIDGGGGNKEERDLEHRREWTKREFSWAVRDAAANLLRIIRGAGKPHELLAQMKKTIDAAIAFQEAYNYWPFDEIANDLRLENEKEKFLERERSGTLDKASIERWRDDGTFDQMGVEHTIFRGTLQIIASRLIGQATQESAGDSEFHDGLRGMERIRDERLERIRAEKRATSSARKKRKLHPRKPKAPTTV